MFRTAWLLPVTLVTGCAVQDMFCNLVEPDSYVLVSAARCQTIQVSFDYDAEAGFSELESYDWMPGQQIPAVDGGTQDGGQLHAWVTDAVDARLAEQGLRRDRAAPDFLVSYDVPIEMQATLTLSFVHADSRQALWRGTSDDEGYPARNQAAWEGRIRVAVDKLLGQFPPSAGE